MQSHSETIVKKSGDKVTTKLLDKVIVVPDLGIDTSTYERNPPAGRAASFVALMKLASRSSSWPYHALLFVFETCVAISLGVRYGCCACGRSLTMAAPSPPPPAEDTWALDCWAALEAVDGTASESSMVPHSMAENTTGRRLVANDFNADFSRRLTFHTWVEEDVALDRRGLERYLRRSFAAAGLERQPSGKSGSFGGGAHRPKTVEALLRDFRDADFAFDPAYAAQAHHMLSGAPWSHGRDEFMHLIRHGLRPNHYFLSLSCGPLATGHHVVRYLLTGRYTCIESDEYLLRAAVEYEIPSKGLIHKRPRFLLDDVSEVAALTKRPPAWLPSPPSHYDFVVVQRPVTPTSLRNMQPTPR